MEASVRAGSRRCPKIGSSRRGTEKGSARGSEAKRGRENGWLRHDLADGRNETELSARYSSLETAALSACLPACQPVNQRQKATLAERQAAPRQVHPLRPDRP